MFKTRQLAASDTPAGLTTWEFELEGSIRVRMTNDHTTEEIATELTKHSGSGYVYDHDTIIPVRRIISIERVKSRG